MWRIGAFSAFMALSASHSKAFDTTKAWNGYCIHQFQRIPELANASAIFRVPPSVACECIAPRMAAQTTAEDNQYIARTHQIPQRLRGAFTTLFQACLTIYSPD